MSMEDVLLDKERSRLWLVVTGAGTLRTETTPPCAAALKEIPKEIGGRILFSHS